MGCCGQRRAAVALRTPGPTGPLTPGVPAWFEYIGHTGLTVTGPATGRTYRFESPGATVEVHPRDRAAVYAIPVLRQVEAPKPTL
ncbi:MAG: hypothetical protein ABI693_05010 [Bryobacteraceae bacterium]